MGSSFSRLSLRVSRRSEDIPFETDLDRVLHQKLLKVYMYNTLNFAWMIWYELKHDQKFGWTIEIDLVLG
jgi:hypothetical protein